jgi:ATP-dependent DNA helicase RecG
MARAEPMHRLLQGDVGSGKTAVALVAATLALEDGYQVALMAPTEVLAEQHHRIFSRALAARNMGWDFSGAMGKRSAPAVNSLSSGAGLRIAVGACFVSGRGGVRSAWLVLIDEQHRFGVLQR